MYQSEVFGKCGIVVRCIQKSISPWGDVIASLEVEFPRFILSEWNTHRALSKNAASSRAIGILRQLEMISESPAMPVYYGLDQRGMSADACLSSEAQQKAEQIILEMRDFCVEKVRQLKEECNLHKQTANRYVEPWQMVKGVVTGTEFNNLIALRAHKDAQPEFAELARCIVEALAQADFIQLAPGQYHVPYVETWTSEDAENPEQAFGYCVQVDNRVELLTLEEALRVSASCCAQASYRVLDVSVDKAENIYKDLVTSKPVHASPFEHQATPMTDPTKIQEGTTHTDIEGKCWSGNIKGWIQHRQLIEGNVVRG